MKKSRTTSDPAAGLSLIEKWSIWAAREGETRRLATRLRTGEVSRAEMAFAADLIEGKIKPQQRKPNQPTRITNDAMATFYFHLRAIHPTWQKERVRKEIANMFGVKDRHIYNVLQRLGAERRKLYEQNARAAAIRDPRGWDENFMREAVRQVARL